MNLRGWSCLNRASPHVLTGRSHERPGEFTQMSAPDEWPSPIALKSYRRWHRRYDIIRFSPHAIFKAILLQFLIVTVAVVSLPFETRAAKSTQASGQSGDSTWPRECYQDGNRLIIYQPQVDDWKNFQDLSWRMAEFPPSQKPGSFSLDDALQALQNAPKATGD